MANDILFENNVPIISNGDFVIGEANAQHIEAICESEQGHWKQYPVIGVGLKRQINGSFDSVFFQKLRIQLELDLFDVEDIKYTNGILIINATKE